jgi:hypothetical protein
MLAATAFWMFYDVDWTALGAAIASGQVLWIGLAAMANLLALAAMAGRWLALLRPFAPLLRLADAFKAMVMGFTVSLIVPARAGELARIEWMGRRSGLPRASLAGSVILDHLVNATGLLLGLGVLPFFLAMPGWLRSGGWVALTLFVIAAGAVVLIRPHPEAALHDAPAGHTSRGALLQRWLHHARSGLTAARDRRTLATSFAVSLLAWALEVVVIQLSLRAFALQVPVLATCVVLLAVNIALVVPFAPPGNLGTLELGATLSLMEFGVPKEKALAFALAYHFLQVIPIGMMGLALGSQTLARALPELDDN